MPGLRLALETQADVMRSQDKVRCFTSLIEIESACRCSSPGGGPTGFWLLSSRITGSFSHVNERPNTDTAVLQQDATVLEVNWEHGMWCSNIIHYRHTPCRAAFDPRLRMDQNMALHS
jgi:hypothetical protein